MMAEKQIMLLRLLAERVKVTRLINEQFRKATGRSIDEFGDPEELLKLADDLERDHAAMMVAQQPDDEV